MPRCNHGLACFYTAGIPVPCQKATGFCLYASSSGKFWRRDTISPHKGSIRLSCLILQQLAEYAKTHFHDDFPRRRLLDMSLRLMSSRQMTLYRSASFLLSLCQKSKRWLWIFWLSFWTCSFSFHRLCESFSFQLIWCCSFASLFCD